MEVVLIIAVIGIAAIALGGGGAIPGISSSGGGAGFMGNLNAEQIAVYASNAGFSGSDLVMSVAVALGESSGNPSAVGDNGNSIGLWQINTPAHPEFSGQDLTDPQVNANAAFSVYSAAGNSWHPWGAYTNGSASNYLGQASAGVTAMQSAQGGVSA